MRYFVLFICLFAVITAAVAFATSSFFEVDYPTVFLFWLILQMFFIHFSTSSEKLTKFFDKHDKTK